MTETNITVVCVGYEMAQKNISLTTLINQAVQAIRVSLFEPNLI